MRKEEALVSEDDEIMRMTPWACMVLTMESYGIQHNLTSRMGEHFVNDFMDLMCRQRPC